MNKITKSPATSPGSSPAFAITGKGGGGGDGLTTWSSQIVSGGDDGWWDDTNAFNNSATTNVVGYDRAFWGKIYGWWRFQNVTIPQGTVISTATLSLVMGADAAASFIMRIAGEDVDDSAQFADSTDADNAPWTGDSYINWTGSAGWATSGTVDSPEIKEVIQEIVDRSGWASGNNLTILVEYDGPGIPYTEEYSFRTYEFSSGSALLTIKY